MSKGIKSWYKTNKKTFWLGLIIGVILLFVLINFTIKPFYKLGCCKYNNIVGNVTRQCDSVECEWDGECTAEITDECCMNVRMCGGHVENAYDCFDQYCATDGYKCGAEFDISGGYDCTCVPVYENN